MPNLDMRNMRDHHPARGDQVEAWIENFLETGVSGEDEANVIEALLVEYRQAADAMLTLEEVVNGEHEPPKRGTLKKKKVR